VGRRLEARGQVNGALWVDDYAHHPTEIEAALGALQTSYGRPIVAVFQPHRYSRTHALLDRFATCFHGVETLVLLPIYPAGEMPIDGVSSERLAKAVEEAHGPRVILAHSFAEAAEAATQALRPEAVLATIGAGDVYRIGELIRGGTR
jgi:UDP-N-acetylmuramate--alanine ligase